MSHEVIYCAKSKVLFAEREGVEPEVKGLGYFLYECMKRNGSNIAQIDAATDKRETYADYLSRCVRFAEGLKLLGLRGEDVVAVCTHNTFNSSVPFIAVQFIGALYLAIDPDIRFADQTHQLNLIKPKVIISAETSVAAMEAALVEIGHKATVIVFESPKFNEMLALKAEVDTYTPHTAKDPNETAMMYFSSGTTGLSKAVCISHNSAMHRAIKSWESCGTIGVTLNYTPISWVSKSWCMISAIYSNSSSLLCSYFDAELLWHYIKKYNVKHLVLSSVQILPSLQYLPENWTGGPECLLFGGSIMSVSKMQLLTSSLPNTTFIQMYGQTEIGLSIGTKKGHASMSKLGTCGIPLPGTQIKIVDIKSEKALGFNEVGEIRVKPSYPAKGYFNHDSSHCYDADGFFKSGDLGYYDEDCCIYITGRCKDAFKYRFYHIMPAKLESILEEHPAVQRAAVIGVPHPKDGNHAMGVVVLNAGAKTTAGELEKFVESRVLDCDRLRAGVKIVDSFPVTPSGKIKKNDLLQTIGF